MEPLADALEISVLELMKSEKMMSDEVTKETAEELLTDTLLVVKLQRRQERRHALRILGVTGASVQRDMEKGKRKTVRADVCPVRNHRSAPVIYWLYNVNPGVTAHERKTALLYGISHALFL